MENNPACSDSILVGWVCMANFTNIRDGIVMTRAPLGLLDGFCAGLRILIFRGMIWSFKGKDYLSCLFKKLLFRGEGGRMILTTYIKFCEEKNLSRHPLK